MSRRSLTKQNQQPPRTNRSELLNDDEVQLSFLTFNIPDVLPRKFLQNQTTRPRPLRENGQNYPFRLEIALRIRRISSLCMPIIISRKCWADSAPETYGIINTKPTQHGKHDIVLTISYPLSLFEPPNCDSLLYFFSTPLPLITNSLPGPL